MSDILAQIPLSAIRVFEAAARLKSFTRAAEELGITQAAVSWQVKALEKRLGQSLFVRLPRQVEPTASGERLARAATEALGLLRGALSELTETAEGVLSITALPSFAGQWLAPRLGDFQLAHPKIAVRLEVSSRVVDLQREPFDVAVRGGGGDWPGLESHHLGPADLTPLCTPAFARAHGGLGRAQDLLDTPRIGEDSEWAQWFEAAGVTDAGAAAGARLATDSQVIEVGVALAGQGLALGSPFLWRRELAEGRLIQPVPVEMPYSQYWLVYPKERRRSPKIAAFRDWMAGQVAEDSQA
ncbi:LysR substrate-binding domain-containing protein [Phenylobacterium sp.]|uniref:LysR substrate-binding domain-containing protein n=1 Tax=Phenylobacterium sp. TaxID=1871053 RepID=UPI0035AF0EDF